MSRESQGEPDPSFTYGPKRSLYDLFSRAAGSSDGRDKMEAIVLRVDESVGDGEESKDAHVSSGASDRQYPSTNSTTAAEVLREKWR